MKQVLKYYYNLKKPTVYKHNNEIKIKDAQDRYILTQFEKINELNDIYNLIHDENIENNYNKIVTTVNGGLYCQHKNEKYVLLKISKNKERQTSTKHKNKVSREKYQNIDKSNWKELWQIKKEYYERLTGKTKNVIHDYYNVMADTAINYLSETKTNTGSFTITHKRIDEETLKNPLNIVVDIEEREIAEQLRYKIIRKNITEEWLEKCVKYCIQNHLDLSKIYARILFPSYYYDYLDKNKEIANITDILPELIYYENKLKEINKEFNKYQSIKKVDWL